MRNLVRRIAGVGPTAMFLLALGASMTPAKADTLAAVGTNGHAVGYVNGGVGFSFVPTEDMTVTQVGYRSSGFGHLIRFWADANLVASYDLGPDPVANTMVYSNAAPLNLWAGQKYYVTLQNGPLSSSNAVVVDVSFGTAPAPEISAYESVKLNYDGTFTNIVNATNAATDQPLLLGPNFYYELGHALVPAPQLSIVRSGANVLVSWPSPSNGFLLQTNGDVGNPPGWSIMAGPANDDGTTKSVTLPVWTGNLYFRLKE